MQRRRFLKSVALPMAVAGTASVSARSAVARVPERMKITRIRFYHNPNSRSIFNQSYHIVTVETDAGITGIGEGGSAETVKQCAAML